MPPVRAVVLQVLVLLLELVAVTGILLSTDLQALVPGGLAITWLVLMAGTVGLVVATVSGTVRLPVPWDRIALLIGAAPAALLPAALIAGSGMAFLVGTIVLLLAYWRGLAVGSDTPDSDTVRSRFALGLLLILIAAIWLLARGIHNSSADWHLLALLGVGYLLLSLLAMVLARLERERAPGAGGAVFLAAGLQLGALAMLSLLALQLFAVDLAGELGVLTRPVWDVIGSAGYHILLLLAGPVDHLFSLIRPHHRSGTRPAFAPLPGDTGTFRVRKIRPTQSTLISVLGALFLMLILIGVALLVWRSLPRRHQRIDPGFREERGHSFTLVEAWRALLVWLRGLRTVRPDVIARAVGNLIGPWRPVYPEDPVRRMYAQFLHESALAGSPRAPGVTPAEFATALLVRYPGVAAPVAALTEAYEERRYGERQPMTGRHVALQQHLDSVRNALRAPRQTPAVSRETDVPRTGSVARVGQDAWQGLGGKSIGAHAGLLVLLGLVVAPAVIVLVVVLVVATGGH